MEKLTIKKLIENIADDIIQNRKFKTIQKSDKIKFLLVDIANAKIMFGTEPQNEALNEFKDVLISNITEEFRKAKMFDTFKAGHWLISKEEDHNRKWTDEEKQKIYKYGTADTQTYDYIFKNTETNEEFIVTRKAKN